MPENPEIPEIPEFPDVPEAPKMPESRPRRSPERLRASILSDLESLFWSIFVVFRGFALLTALALLGSIFGSIFAVFRDCLARASRLAPTGPTLTKVWQGYTFVRVGRCALEPQSIEIRCERAPRTTCANIRKSSENREKIERKSVCERAAQRKLDVAPPGVQKSVVFSAVPAIWGSRKKVGSLRGIFWGLPGTPKNRGLPHKGFFGAPWASPGRSETLPYRSRDAFGTLFDSTGRPERVPGAILGRF